jgi:integrase
MAVVKYKDSKKRTRYLVRIRIYDNEGVFVKHSSKGGFETSRDARNYETSFLSAKKNSSVLFQQVVDHYLEYYKSHNKYSSYKSTKNAIKLHILPYFENKDIHKITPKDILDWKIDMQGKGLFAISYLNKIRTQLVALFNHMVKYFDLDKSPAAGIGGFKNKEKKTEMSFWTLDEFNQFMKYVDDPLYRLFFNMLFYTGIRKGEAQAVQWKDINFKKGLLNISKTWAALGDGSYGPTAPKTPNAYRSISLDRNTLTSLLENLAEAKKYEGFSNSFYVIGNVKPLSTTQLDRMFNKLILISNVKKIRIHDLRHSNASLLISLGADIVLVTKRLGHASSKETFDTYSHLYPDKQAEIIDLL